jgi:uncharacterized phage-associated protein
MAKYDPRALANEFLRLGGGVMNQMKLQKLVYIANGWNLAINNEPLTDDLIEAWDGGPVFRAIWNHIRDFGHNAKGGLLGDPQGQAYRADLTQDEKSVLEHVWKRYGGYSGLELSRMTHQEGTPWSNAYFGRGRNTPLDQADIKQHFVELALAGRK